MPLIIPGPSFRTRSTTDGSTWGFYELHAMTAYTDELLHDPAFRERSPSLARTLRVVEIAQLAHLVTDLESLTGDDAALAAAEVDRTEHALFHGTPNVRIKLEAGSFPTSARDNIISRARLAAFRDAGATHVYVRFSELGPSLQEILSQPPWTAPAHREPPRVVIRDSLRGFHRPRVLKIHR